MFEAEISQRVPCIRLGRAPLHCLDERNRGAVCGKFGSRYSQSQISSDSPAQIGAGPSGQHAEEFDLDVGRLADMGLYGQIEVMGLRRAGLRATWLKIRGHGGIAEQGVTEPGVEEDLSDWS
ncbi:hypothetical protein ABIE45_005672 [Methylobacterium sp. OAE515]|uniref:hypothetical protein n=1 Tax=Methylobacterium sp. OAE515 TaxID=2817895 RepID=UPI00178B0681